jgi:hypothetical protein
LLRNAASLGDGGTVPSGDAVGQRLDWVAERFEGLDQDTKAWRGAISKAESLMSNVMSGLRGVSHGPAEELVQQVYFAADKRDEEGYPSGCADVTRSL